MNTILVPVSVLPGSAGDIDIHLGRETDVTVMSMSTEKLSAPMRVHIKERRDPRGS